MKQYYVRTISTATGKNVKFKGETHVHYTGKSGVPHSYYDFDAGWKRRGWAERHIEELKELYKRDDMWARSYKVIAVDEHGHIANTY